MPPWNVLLGWKIEFFSLYNKDKCDSCLWSLLLDPLLLSSIYNIFIVVLQNAILNVIVVALRINSFLFSVKPENVQLLTDITVNKTCLGSHWNFTCLVGAANPEVTYYQLLENDIAVDTDSSGMWMRTLSNSGFFTYKCLANNTVGTTISVNEENVTIAGNNFTSIFYFLRKRLLYVLFVCRKNFPFKSCRKYEIQQF